MNRRKCCTHITKKDGTNVCDKCCRCAVLCKAYTMVRYVWLYQPWILVAGGPVKVTAVYDHTTDSCTVATDELCCRMDHDIRTILDRTYQIRGCKCIIYDQWNIMGMCNICNALNINHLRIWITQSLNLDRCGVLLDGCLNSFIIKWIYEGCLNAVIRKSMCQKIVGSTVNILSCYNMISFMCYCLECIRKCCCTTTYCQSCHTALKSGNSLLEGILGRVC